MEKLFKLSSELSLSGDQKSAFSSLIRGLESGLHHQVLLGVTGSGKTFTIANVIAHMNRPTIVLVPNKILAAQLYSEMKIFFPENAIEYFVSYYDYYQPEAYIPYSDTFIEKSTIVNKNIDQMRLSAIKSLLERKDVIIISSVSAIYGIGDPNIYLDGILNLKKYKNFSQEDIVSKLLEMRYIRNNLFLQRGGFRVMENFVDVFPAESNEIALKIKLLDNKIDMLYLFDPITGSTKKEVYSYSIYPKSHCFFLKGNIENIIKDIKLELDEQCKILLSDGKILEVERLSKRVNSDIEMIKELGYCYGIENYSKYFSYRNSGDPPSTILNYITNRGLLIIDESHITIPQINSMYYSNASRKKTLIEYGFRLPSSLDNRPITFEEFSIISPQTIYMSATPGTYELKMCNNKVIKQIIRPTGLLDPEVEVRSVSTQVDDIMLEIYKRSYINDRIIIVALTKKIAEDLSEYFNEKKIKARYLHSNIDILKRIEIIHDFRLGKFNVLIGINLLREGLDIPEVSLVAILDADKEGFLRSKKSLIQIIGRASRNINGKVILYGSKITLSMKKAIEETEYRRMKQKKYNLDNNIKPKPLNKKISRDSELISFYKKKNRNKYKNIFKYKNSTSKSLNKEISNLEKVMLKYVKKLEFEKASIIRDHINSIKEYIIKNSVI